MSKTPEEMAEEYAKTEGQPWGCERHFLAGYQAAQQWISVKEVIIDGKTYRLVEP